MKIATNNMGAITKKQIENFAFKVLKDLDLKDWKMKWTIAGDICMRSSHIIYIDKNAVWKYPWRAKERVLHEIAHIFTMDKFHGPEFYEEYIKLLERFMCKGRKNESWRGDE